MPRKTESRVHARFKEQEPAEQDARAPSDESEDPTVAEDSILKGNLAPSRTRWTERVTSDLQVSSRAGRAEMSSSGPKFVRFAAPIISALQELGGSGTAAEVCDRVADNLGITEEDLSERLNSGQSRIRNQMQWARMYLVKGGLLDSSQRGIWTLTKTGLDGLRDDEALPLFRRLAKKYRDERKVKKQIEEDSGDEPDGPEDDGQTSDLLAVLQSLSAEGFERICQRLLRESGFQQVTVTGRSGDGGIDGFGVLEVNPLVSFNVLFQCKKYQGSVSTSQVRDFRGAMQGRADKGIILTTGTFTSDAKKESRRDGAPPIELVDGEKLVSMFERLELGVKPRTVYEINDAFFDEFR